MKKKLISTLLLLPVVLNLCACSLYSETSERKITVESIPINKTQSVPQPLTIEVDPVNTTESQSYEICGQYLYNQLSEKHKKIYLCIYKAFKEHTEVSFDESYSYTDIEKVAELFFSQEPYACDFCSGYSYTNSGIKLSHRYSKQQEQQYIEATEKQISVILKNMPAGDYNRVKYFHDYLITNCTYQQGSEFDSSPYGTLVQKQALCQGYAHTFALLCSRAGIDCISVAGVAEGPHIWNMVKIDGEWYVMDVTWDDADYRDFPAYISYNYFLVNKSVIKNRTIETPGIPEATATKNNYFYKTGKVITNASDTYSVVYKSYEDALKNGQKYASVKFADATAYQTGINYLVNNNGLYKVQCDIRNAGYGINERQMLYLANPDTLTATFFIF